MFINKMDLSSTSSSIAINEGSQQYPYPSHVNAASFLSIKLSGTRNYVRWVEQMFCLVDAHDMVGFINGKLRKPLISNGSITKEALGAFEAKYREWKRSDALVKGWIFGSLSEDVMGTVVGFETANQVWSTLKTNYTPPLPAPDVPQPARTPPLPAPDVPQPARTPPLPAPNVSQSVSTPLLPLPDATTINTAKKELGEYLQLIRAIREGDWEKAEIFFNEDKDALTDKLLAAGHRALHMAIGSPQSNRVLDKLLEQINPDSLPTLVTNALKNALHYAASLDNSLAAKKLVEKNPNLLFIVDKDKSLPIEIAINNSHKTTFLYLLKMCKQHIGLSQKEGYNNPFEGEHGVSLLTGTILAGFMDVAYDLLKEYPILARTKVKSVMAPLLSIAKKWNAYPSAQRYNFYQKFVYSQISIDNPLHHAYKIEDIETQATYRASPVTKCTKNSYVYSVFQKIIVKLWKVAILYVPHIKRLHEDKVKHHTTLMVLKFICEEVSKLKSDHYTHYAQALLVAVKNNTSEVMEQITRTFSQSIWVIDTKGYRIAQLSIINRSENIYNFFVHEVTIEKHFHNVLRDSDDNNLLHLAAQLAPTHKLNTVTGAALRMQRELQWFQEVGKLMRPKDTEAVNKKQETPLMVFRKEHKDLRQEGEEWMKKTAESYTITAALIITIVFAAAITVPGGNNGDTGSPIYETKPSFIVFAVSDAISLFTSTTSLLLFLSILTARFEEEDFLYKLPKRLILGLVMLFMSVTSMMIAFSATLYIMFGLNKSWVLIPIASLTGLPIVSFVTLQLPLLVDLIASTYGPGIFAKGSELRITT
ncbi:hypothetical protein SSX86_013103 [Deinandra increscens subsp. villosa]|uniref:PGG domain-containing protein n=1 Tax=Deinandra increscens subsp. villosa TaxID=3103831 RepID=A0AAP0DAK9_9ASTR